MSDEQCRTPVEALLKSDALCAREPIRVPGSIQPHGCLLVLESDSLKVLQVSDNVESMLGLSAQRLLDSTLQDWAGDGLRRMLLSRLSALPADNENPVFLGSHLLGSGTFSCCAHRQGTFFILEFEPVNIAMPGFEVLSPDIHAFIGRLQQEDSLERLCQLAVEEFKHLTGFGRVKLYSFDAEGNGTVRAEVADEGYPRYLGLCFPGSDIPPQARALYLANRIRMIPDARYRPVPLIPQLNPVTGQPLDLGFAMLRSVSPVHVQYMQNMQTLASLSVSLVVKGQLWGLISCHDLEPHCLDLPARMACDLLGRVLSLQIEAREAHARTEYRYALGQLTVRMLSAMADQDSVVVGLRWVPEIFLGFAGACGGAVVCSPVPELIGDTPSMVQVERLVDWLARRAGDSPLFVSDNLPRDLPELADLHESVGGILAVSISELHPHYLIWFRPELVKTVRWAGEPSKSRDERGMLNPRNSFKVWQETIRGQARPWEEGLQQSALELRSAVLGLVLRKAEELAVLADELKRSNKELEAFSYSVSHDLRAPLRHIAGYAELLGDFEGSKLSERGARFLASISDSAHFAGTLVDNLLSFSQMGRAALHLSDVNLAALVESICRDMLPDYEGRDIEWRIASLPTVVADASFINLALRNLLANAIKYTRPRSPAIIEIGASTPGSETVLFVRDNGVGFDMSYVSKLFGVFQRLHHADEFEGIGIGLATVRRILERHEGRVWAEAVPGLGATFYLALPQHARSPIRGED